MLGDLHAAPPDRDAPLPLALRERAEAAADVRAVLDAVRGPLARLRPPPRLVEGSAFAVQYEARTERLRASVVRFHLEVPERQFEPCLSELRRLGFAPADPEPDLVLLRRAHERGRRVQHTLFDEDMLPSARPPTGSDARPEPPHPGSPEGIAERTKRLGRWRLEPRIVLRRVRVTEDDDGLARSEAVEVGLVVSEEAQPGARPPQRSE